MRMISHRYTIVSCLSNVILDVAMDMLIVYLFFLLFCVLILVHAAGVEDRRLKPKRVCPRGCSSVCDDCC